LVALEVNLMSFENKNVNLPDNTSYGLLEFFINYNKDVMVEKNIGFDNMCQL
jgi:hypothetical protein